MLGRGLESLIPPQHQSNEPEEVSLVQPAGREIPRIDGPIFHIEVEQIKPNPHQPRKHFDDVSLRELAASISEHGILQPLVVSKIENITEHGRDVEYQLIAGERRLLASKMIGLPRVPVIIKKTGEEREKLELAIVENLQRANLDSIETARAYAKLQDHFGLTQREVAARLGKSREVVANAMRLLSLPSYIQESLSKGQLSESQGRLLLAVADPMQQQTLFDDILRNNLSVRELKTRINRINGKALSANRIAQEDVTPELLEMQDKLEQFLGTKVQLQAQGSKGKITIDFYSSDDLKNLVQKLLPARPYMGGAQSASAPQMLSSESEDFTV